MDGSNGSKTMSGVRRRLEAGESLGSQGLSAAARMATGCWPTPMAGSPAKDGQYNEAGNTCNGLRTVELCGWATPSSQGSAGEVSDDLELRGRKFVNSKTGRVLQTNLATDVKMLVGWATPRASDPKTGSDYTDNMTGKSLSMDASLCAGGWPTPRAEDSEQTVAHGGRADTLNSASKLAASGPTASGSPASMEDPGGSQGRSSRMRLNPFFSGWLMGFRKEWTFAGLIGLSRLPRRSRVARLS